MLVRRLIFQEILISTKVLMSLALTLLISLLSKGLKFVTTPKHINKAKIKEEIEVHGRNFRLMWHFRNDHREFDVNPFMKKSKFNPKGDAAIEVYLSRLKEDILCLDEKISYSNLTKGERNALYLLRDDSFHYYKRS